MPRNSHRFDEQLRDAIRTSQMTRYKIAKATGVDNAVLSRFMAGKVGMSMDSIVKIFDLLDLQITSGKSRRRKGR